MQPAPQAASEASPAPVRPVQPAPRAQVLPPAEQAAIAVPAPLATAPAPPPVRVEPPRPEHIAENGDVERGATAPQLRRFIKSRAYVPMHELRRRFAINGAEDDVTVVDVDRRRVFVGLPEREGRLLGELLRGGDIGYELSLDPITPIVVGVYPMRPVTRA